MKIAILLSGGVDSSVALSICLKEFSQHENSIEAFYLKIWLEDKLSYIGKCPWEYDLFYARSVCTQLGIPLNIINFQEEYYQKVVNYTISELEKGNTPSPDIFCNERIKFGSFLEKFSYYDLIVSGHYASIQKHSNKFFLYQAKDPIKDQSYFLSHLNQKQLSKLYFPLGNLLKTEVRKKAIELDLANKDRPDSQGICFLGEFKYDEFVNHYLGEKEGQIIDYITGHILGKHKGFWFYTIGQRRGIRLSGGPWFVADKDVTNNIVYVIHENFYQSQDEKSFYGEQGHWILEEEPFMKTGLTLKLRHGMKKIQCSLYKTSYHLIKVEMSEPDRGIAPGQFAVIYKDNICLGSLKIHSRIKKTP